ncbi:MAG: hypothetical protein ABIO30_04645, partial [Thermomonas sp.]
GFTPGALRYIWRMEHDRRAFTADVLDLAVRGQLSIKRKKKKGSDQWSLHRLDADRENLLSVHRGMLSNLFAPGPVLELQEKNSAALQSAIEAQQRVFEQAYYRKLFHRHGGSIAMAVVIAVTGLIAAGASGTVGGHVLIWLTAGLMLVTIMKFRRLIKAPTPAGRTVLDEIEGLRLYLGVAEQTDLARSSGPDESPRLDAPQFESLLPCAVALDVEEAWTRKFSAAVGAAAATEATRSIDWYQGGALDSMASLTEAVGSSLGQQIASSSSPAGSSSGGGDGGSSGGGGGGGGGGGR